MTSAFGSDYSLATVLRFPIFVGTFTTEGTEALLKHRDRLSAALSASLPTFTEGIADAVAARLEPLCEHEFLGLTDGGRPAAIDAVVKVFGHTDLSDEALVGADVGAAEWARRIRSQAPPDPGLGDAAIAFYELLLAECCDCYVRLLRRLPVFTERAITELLGRVSSLGAELAQVLERLSARSLYAPVGDDHDEEFKHEYLGLISSELDEVELFSGLAGPALTRTIRPALPAHRPFRAY